MREIKYRGKGINGYSVKERCMIIVLTALVTTALCGGLYISYQVFNPSPTEYTGGF